ncbi:MULTISPECIES: IS3 family transposase [Bacteria]|nr:MULTISPECIES: IS3 family transposase [Psychrobacter]MCC3307012.1 IS3 family transposase [Psychrobacter sanguinis]MCC3308319.1 IS3 family transposase [Psychrobacter sanguinis]MDN3503918.1 IS3 family transposase [Psychrobacter sp. 5A.1]UEC24387.1 IS3 family transposase [Psychrobacter sanguinis]HCH26424.1 IS3 family transposase [Psychrobacter sp.]
MTKKLRTYSNEFKAEAVKKIADNNGNISATAKQLGIAMQTLSNWHNKANQGKLVGTEQYDPDLMSALQEIKQLKRQLKVAEEEREIPKKGDRVLREKQPVKYAFIKDNRQIFSTTTMCRVLSVKPSSYYDWLSRDISEQQVHRNQCELLVKAAHSEMKERYGVDRLHAHLSKQGHNISLYMVRSIKEEHGIKCRRHKRFKVTTDSNHNKLVYDNVLDQRFDAKRPNEAWVSDITYIWTAEGWLYLAGVKDLYTKELVGYAINKRMTADLVCRALNMAIKNKRPTQGLIVHSDRGSQYCSHAYHKIIEQHKFTGSMSGKGNCYDNAPIESFWGVLKNELVYHQDYKTRFAATSDIIGYIELYYNQTRIQKGLGYRAPRQVWFDYYRQAA